MSITADETELFDGAISLAGQLNASENDQHKNLGRMIAGLCAMIAKRERGFMAGIDLLNEQKTREIL